MPLITRAVTPDDLADLLSSSRVAVVAWNRDGQVAVELAAFRFADGRYCFGVRPEALVEQTEVALLVDDGPLYFDLRGVRVRGRIAASDEERRDGLEWFEVKPQREVAWHYGTLRER